MKPADVRGTLHGGFEPAGLDSDPFCESRDPGMRLQLFDRVVFALQLLLAEEGVDLRMARAANTDDLPNERSGEVALVLLVAVSGARNEMMTGERFLPTADRAVSQRFKSSHGLTRIYADEEPVFRNPCFIRVNPWLNLFTRVGL